MTSRGFPKRFIDILVCQKSGEPLKIKSVEDGDEDSILNGMLVSSSGLEYRIKGGILNMLNERLLYAEAKQEIGPREIAAKDYDRKLSPRREKEIPSTIDPLWPWDGMMVVDYGSGTGRVSGELFGANLLAVDMSLSSLLVFRDKETKIKSLGLVCADVTSFQVKPGSFDRAISSQVYEHIPTKDRRGIFLKNIASALKFGGVFVATMYHNDLRRRLRKEKKEGYHSSGIFYHYFNLEEVGDEFATFFNKISIRPFDITLPFEARFKLPPKIGGRLSRIFEKVPLVNQFGHLIRVIGRVQ